MTNFSNTDFIDLDLAKSRMEDYYNNSDKGIKRSIDMVEQPTTGEASKRRKHLAIFHLVSASNK
jgi:hypothetical protein